MVLQQRGVVELERLDAVGHDELAQVRQGLHPLLHFLHRVLGDQSTNRRCDEKGDCMHLV